MGIFKEIPPTAGWPLRLKDFLTVSKPGSIERDLREYIGLDYSRVTYSGTAAFYLILEGLKGLSSKSTVILPSYVCPLLPLAIKRAGLKTEVCDIDKEGFNFDFGELERLCCADSDILAIVAVHLAGIPVDFSRLEAIAKRSGIFIIEDCAQSLGAEYHDRKTGSLGDFAFFSFCRGKGLTIYEGGALTAKRKEHADAIDSKIGLLVKDDFFSEALKILEIFGYWIFYRPQLFWYVFNLPKAFWTALGNEIRAATEYFTVDFPIHNVSGYRKAVAHAIFNRLEEDLARQRQKAELYLSGLREVKGIKVIKETQGSKAAYPYLTLLFDETGKQRRALKQFRNSGLGVSRVYACAVTDYGYLKEVVPQRICPNARYLAEREITLSTSVFLKEQDMDSVVNIIKSI